MIIKGHNYLRSIFWGMVFCFGILGCDGPATTIEVPSFSISPNPFVDQFLLTAEIDFTVAQWNFKILDGTGEVIRESEVTAPTRTVSIDMQDQKPAVYYVEVTALGRTQRTPIIKAK